MSSIIDTLIFSPVLTLFAVICLGYFLGHINLGGFRLGIAGVLFAGLAIGALSPKLALPEIVTSLGLVIFVYSLGIQAGPEIRKSFDRKGLRDTALVIGVICFAALLSFVIGKAIGLPAGHRAGLFCGSVTSTPALAAIRESISDAASQAGMTAAAIHSLTNQPVVAYSVTYPFGVAGVLLAIQFVRWFWKIEIPAPEGGSRIQVRNFVVTNPAVFGKTIADIMRPHKERDFILSRVRHDGRTHIPTSESVLNQGDIIVAVGEEHGLELAGQILGSPSVEQLHLDRTEFDYRRMYVSSPEVVGKAISELNLVRRFSAIITRVRRGDVDMIPQPEMCLEHGDRVRVLSHRNKFEELAVYFGDSIRGTAEADFGAMGAGMVAGVLVGMLPIQISGSAAIRLGLAGGPLLVALVLGNIQRIGRVRFTMPASANLTLRQAGLLLFLSGVGTRAGYEFVHTIRETGLTMLLAGGVITLVTSMLALVIGARKFKLPYDYLMGLMAGIQTQSAVLGFAHLHSKTDAPDVAYAASYPAATIVKIILAQLVLSLAGGLILK